MSDSATPYDAPASSRESGALKTAAGFTSGQCFLRFFIVGVVAATVGGTCLFKASESDANMGVQLGALGLPFAGALMLSIRRWNGSLTIAKSLFVLVGAVAGFVACAFVYIQTINLLYRGSWASSQPVSWATLAPCFYGAASGAAILSFVLWVSGGRFTWRMASIAWATMTAFGFTAIALSDEIGMRRRIVSEALSSGIAGGVYVAVLLAMLGWYLAEANGVPGQDA